MKHFLKIAAIAPIVFFAACSKNTPSLGLNSDMKISQIKVAGFSDPSGSGTILAVGNFTFVKANPTTAADTSRLVDSFYLPTTNGYDHNLNFNTPQGTKNLYLDMAFFIDGGATATGLTIDNVKIDYNDKNILNSGLINGNTLGNKTFKMPTQTATY